MKRNLIRIALFITVPIWGLGLVIQIVVKDVWFEITRWYDNTFGE